jgi:hypothetical protein
VSVLPDFIKKHEEKQGKTITNAVGELVLDNSEPGKLGWHAPLTKHPLPCGRPLFHIMSDDCLKLWCCHSVVVEHPSTTFFSYVPRRIYDLLCYFTCFRFLCSEHTAPTFSGWMWHRWHIGLAWPPRLMMWSVVHNFFCRTSQQTNLHLFSAFAAHRLAQSLWTNDPWNWIV